MEAIYNSTDDNTLGSLELAGHGYVVPIVAALGMVLNGLSLPVLASRHFRQSAYTYLAALAIADFLLLLLFGLNAVGKGHFPRSYSWVVFEAKVYLPCGFMCSTVSMLLTLFVAVERCVILYWPTRAKRWCNHKQAREVVLFISACGIVYSVPGYFAYDINDVPPYHVAFTDFGRGWFHMALCWIHVLVSLGVCFGLVVLDVLLIRGLRPSLPTLPHRRSLSLQPSGQQRQKREEACLTRTLASLLTLFILTELPFVAVSQSSVAATRTVTTQDVTDHQGYAIASLVVTTLVVLQHSVKFVVYCLCTSRFLAVLQAKLCRPVNLKRTTDVPESPPSRRLVQTLNT